MTSRMIHHHQHTSIPVSTSPAPQPTTYIYPTHPVWQAAFIVLGGAVLSAIFLLTSPLLPVIVPNPAQTTDVAYLILIGLMFSVGVLLLYGLDVVLTYVIAVWLLDADGNIKHLAYRSAMPGMLIFAGSIGMLCIRMNEHAGNMWNGMGFVLLILPLLLVGQYVIAVREALHISPWQANIIGFTKVVLTIMLVLIVMWMLVGRI